MDEALKRELENLDGAFAEAKVEDRNASPPDGKYVVKVERVELTRSREKQIPMLAWTLKIEGPTHAGRLLFRNNLIGTPENVKWLKQDLRTCGVEISKLSELDVAKLLDIRLNVTKKTKNEYENVYLDSRADEAPAQSDSQGTPF